MITEGCFGQSLEFSFGWWSPRSACAVGGMLCSFWFFKPLLSSHLFLLSAAIWSGIRWLLWHDLSISTNLISIVLHDRNQILDLEEQGTANNMKLIGPALYWPAKGREILDATAIVVLAYCVTFACFVQFLLQISQLRSSILKVLNFCIDGWHRDPMTFQIYLLWLLRILFIDEYTQ